MSLPSKAFLFVAAAIFIAPAHAGALERGPYIVDASSTTAVICWRQAKKDQCQDVAGLVPAFAFNYTVSGSSQVWRGRALPGPEQALRFAAFGDSGQGDQPQFRVAAVLNHADPNLVLLLGDVVYPKGTDRDYDLKYFRPYASTLSQAPFFPAVGNHDYGSKSARQGRKCFDEGYARILHKPRFYSFNAGPVHFISLDTNQAYRVGAAAPIGPGSAQRRWLEQDLARTKARWKIVFLHVPLYTTALHHGDNAFLRRSLESLFQKYGVDLVLQGHDHFYERSRSVGGVVYLTVGTGGGALHIGPEVSNPDWLEKRIREYGLIFASVNDTRLHLEFLDDAGKPLDQLDLQKR